MLTGTHWLNDQIITFYFKYLESSKFADASDCFLFVAPSVCQLLKMSLPENCQDLLSPLKPHIKSLVFFAVNNNNGSGAGGTHWSLLVYSREEDTFFSFDSLNNYNNYATQKLINVLKIGLGCHSANAHNISCSQQINGHDCGIHLVSNCENVCDYYLRKGAVVNVPLLSSLQVRSKRADIFYLVLHLSGVA